MKPFISRALPLATDDDLERAYALGLLRKAALEHGMYYRGTCRNAHIARWHALAQRFVYMRHKYSDWFAEAIAHPADDRVFDVFRPVELAAPELVSDEQRVDDQQFDDAAQRRRAGR